MSEHEILQIKEQIENYKTVLTNNAITIKCLKNELNAFETHKNISDEKKEITKYYQEKSINHSLKRLINLKSKIKDNTIAMLKDEKPKDRLETLEEIKVELLNRHKEIRKKLEDTLNAINWDDFKTEYEIEGEKIIFNNKKSVDTLEITIFSCENKLKTDLETELKLSRI